MGEAKLLLAVVPKCFFFPNLPLFYQFSCLRDSAVGPAALTTSSTFN